MTRRKRRWGAHYAWRKLTSKDRRIDRLRREEAARIARVTREAARIARVTRQDRIFLACTLFIIAAALGTLAAVH